MPWLIGQTRLLQNGCNCCASASSNCTLSLCYSCSVPRLQIGLHSQLSPIQSQHHRCQSLYFRLLPLHTHTHSLAQSVSTVRAKVPSLPFQSIVSSSSRQHCHFCWWSKLLVRAPFTWLCAHCTATLFFQVNAMLVVVVVPFVALMKPEHAHRLVFLSAD